MLVRADEYSVVHSLRGLGYVENEILKIAFLGFQMGSILESLAYALEDRKSQ